MPSELLDGVLAAYGLPTAVTLWLLWNVWFKAPKKDVSVELLETLRSLDTRLDTVSDRLIRVETKVEMMNGR